PPWVWIWVPEDDTAPLLLQLELLAQRGVEVLDVLRRPHRRLRELGRDLVELLLRARDQRGAGRARVGRRIHRGDVDAEQAAALAQALDFRLHVQSPMLRL